MDTDYVEWILRCFDALQGCSWNYLAVFGAPLIDLPAHISEDIRALKHRDAQVNAEKS